MEYRSTHNFVRSCRSLTQYKCPTHDRQNRDQDLSCFSQLFSACVFLDALASLKTMLDIN